jgi:5-methyltetrahydropteroyltriglutamate--homocysteine methyltransferase
MSQHKPPHRAEHVGSLLRSARLAQARASHKANDITATQLKEIENEEIERVVRKQEDVGLQTITDGEYRRAFWHYDFLEGLGGVETYVPKEATRFKGAVMPPVALRTVGKISGRHHPMLEHFRFLRQHTSRTPKMTIPAPSALHYRWWRESVDKSAYPSMEEFFQDLALAYQQVVQDLAAAGCRYLQLDEVFLAYLCDPEQQQILRDRGEDPEALKRIYGEMINIAVARAPKDMVTAMHLCRGNFRSSFVASGGYWPIAKQLFNEINIQVYYMEYDSERAGGFEPLMQVPKGKTVVLGLVTSKTGDIEERALLKERIEEAAQFVPLEQICLSPQCGFASTQEGNNLAEEQQWRKLSLVVDVAKEVWPS